jgi:beta-phosphoglucomutase
MNIAACIFDLEGIIIDTSKYHYLAWKKLAMELGFELSIEQYEKFNGIESIHSVERILEIGGIKMAEGEKLAAANKKNLIYQTFIQKLTADEILPGVYEFLIELKTNHSKLALGSSNKSAKIILQRLELYNLFNSIIDGNVISKVKPDPEIFLKILDDLKVKSADCLVFESNVAGIEAAHKAEMVCIGLGNPSQLSSANFVIPGFDSIELSDVLKMLNQ